MAPCAAHLAAAEGPQAERDWSAAPLPALVAHIVEHEHVEVAQMLQTLRTLTSGFTAPATACNSFRGLYQMLAELEADTHTHIHLENNVLFPRAEELVPATATTGGG